MSDAEQRGDFWVLRGEVDMHEHDDTTNIAENEGEKVHSKPGFLRVYVLVCPAALLNSFAFSSAA